MAAEEFDDADYESGFYSFRELKQKGYVKDRSDLHRKQRRYEFPRMIKTGERQAGALRSAVHRWAKKRAAISATASK